MTMQLPDDQPTVDDDLAKAVFVVDDEAASRDSLTFALEAAGYHPTAFPAAEPFLAAVDVGSAEGCLLCDLRLPGMSGVDLLEELVRRGSRLCMIVMTAYGDIPAAVRAMRAGASDVLEKPFDPGQIVAAVRRALQAGPPLHGLRLDATAAAAKLATLTERERAVFDLLVVGRLGKEAARDLDLSPRTVEAHRANIMRRLNTRTLPDLVRLSILAGMKF